MGVRRAGRRPRRCRRCRSGGSRSGRTPAPRPHSPRRGRRCRCRGPIASRASSALTAAPWPRWRAEGSVATPTISAAPRADWNASARHDARRRVGERQPRPCARPAGRGRTPRRISRLDRVGGGVALGRSGGARRRTREAEADPGHRVAGRAVVSERRRVRVEQPASVRTGSGSAAGSSTISGARVTGMSRSTSGSSPGVASRTHSIASGTPSSRCRASTASTSAVVKSVRTQPRPGVVRPAGALPDEQLKRPDRLDPNARDPRDRVVAALDPGEQRQEIRVNRGRDQSPGDP